MKQQWEMCMVEKYIRLNEQQQELLKLGQQHPELLTQEVVQMLEYGENFFKIKLFTSAGDSNKEFSSLDEAIEYLLQDGWEPFSIIANKEDEYKYHFRRRIQ